MQLVVFIRGKLLDPRLETVHRRHTPSRHIEIIPSDRECRGIIDVYGRQCSTSGTQDLPQRHHAVPQPCSVATDDMN